MKEATHNWWHFLLSILCLLIIILRDYDTINLRFRSLRGLPVIDGVWCTFFEHPY